MYFRRIVLSALFVGVLAGLWLSLLQTWQVVPIILEAEKYEVVTGSHVHEGDSTESWAPSDGVERTLYTVFSNVLAACGFAMVMIALMAIQRRAMSILKGVLWGVAGFCVFFMVPSLGLEPEIPGMEAAALLDRQLWWVATVICTATGLAVMVFAPFAYKIIGAAVIALPFLMSAPLPETVSFAERDGVTQQTLMALAEQFVHATTLTNGLYWIALGVLSGLCIKKYIYRDTAMNVN